MMKKQHIGHLFLEGSTYESMPQTDQEKGMTQPPLEMPYQGVPLTLPKIETLTFPSLTLKEAIINRQSHRLYRSDSLSLEELSYVLYMTQGVKRTRENLATFRTVPSAGARHPFETYLAIQSVSGLSPGLYRYLALSHELIQINASNQFTEGLYQACLKQKMVKDAPVTFIWVADSYRTTFRYGMRGYRYLFLDAGHVCQNLYLVAEQLSMGTCAIAAFDDQAINQLMELDGQERFVIYLAPFGKIKK